MRAKPAFARGRADRRIRLQLSEISEALARFYNNTPHEPFTLDRVKPLDLLRRQAREVCRVEPLVPLEETNEGILIR